jgi:hypothetical protein
VIKSNCGVNHALQKEFICASGFLPDVFPSIVAFKKFALVKFINAAQKVIVMLIDAHGQE